MKIKLDDFNDFYEMMFDYFSKQACKNIWEYLCQIEKDEQEVDEYYYMEISDSDIESIEQSWSEYSSLYKYLEEHCISQRYIRDALEELDNNNIILTFVENGETVFDNNNIGFVVSNF